MQTPKVFSFLILTMLFGLVGSSQAVDGVVLIDQAKALAGGVTPGDSPGFPVRINQSGSYRLSGNLTVPDANTTGISISASNVTLDLNGFSILGPTVCDFNPTLTCAPTGNGSGVHTIYGYENIVVKNGFIQGMGLDGISLGSLNIIVDKMVVSNNGGNGIFCHSCIVTNSIAFKNLGYGIVGSTSLFLGNRATGNHNYGLSGEFGTGYSNNVLSGNEVGNVSPGPGFFQLGPNVCGGALCP
jgi:hypothetical protein